MKELDVIVTIKQVPDTHEVKIDPRTNSLIREGVPSIVNPEDLNALEAALALRDIYGGTVTALTMGPPQAEEALELAVAMGADRGILLSDRAFAGSDTLITAFTISRAVMKLKKYDLIICGRQAIDGDTAQVGPQLAGFLELPQITYAEEIILKDDRLVIKRSLEDYMEWVSAVMPVLITVTSEINRPRFPFLSRIKSACDGSSITKWDVNDLKIPKSMLGLNASPTVVKRIFNPERAKKGEFIPGNEKEMALKLIENLKNMNVISH